MESLSLSTAALVIINIAAVAYTYGQLNQKVSDISRRLNDMSHRIEKIEDRGQS